MFLRWLSVLAEFFEVLVGGCRLRKPRGATEQLCFFFFFLAFLLFNHFVFRFINFGFSFLLFNFVEIFILSSLVFVFYFSIF